MTRTVGTAAYQRLRLTWHVKAAAKAAAGTLAHGCHDSAASFTGGCFGMPCSAKHAGNSTSVRSRYQQLLKTVMVQSTVRDTPQPYLSPTLLVITTR